MFVKDKINVKHQWKNVLLLKFLPNYKKCVNWKMKKQKFFNNKKLNKKRLNSNLIILNNSQNLLMTLKIKIGKIFNFIKKIPKF